MRLAAIILSAFAFLALGAGIFSYWIGSAFICFDTCPPVSSAGPQLIRIVLATISPGLLLSLAAWITGLLYTRADGRTTAFIVILVTPFAVAIIVALIMLVVGGGLTPIAVSGPPDVAPADRQLSANWLNVTRYAAIPLIIWPVATFIAVLLRSASPQG